MKKPNPLMLLLILFPVCFVAYGRFYLPRQREAQFSDWIRTPCTIEKSAVLTHESERANPTFEFTIDYRYRVEGKTFHGSRFTPGWTTTSQEADILALVKEHPAKADSYCFYNPENHSESVFRKARE